MMRPYALAALAVAAQANVDAKLDPMRTFGATIWSPCYFLRANLPVLWDAAATIGSSGMGSRVIKVPAYNPAQTLPYNSKWGAYSSLAGLLALPYYDALFQNTMTGVSSTFSEFVMVAYRVGPTQQYWTGGMSAADVAAETAQFAAATQYLLTKFAGSQKTFLAECWELDWAARGAFDPSVPLTTTQAVNARAWLSARQAGVNQGRAAFMASLIATNNASAAGALTALQGVPFRSSQGDSDEVITLELLAAVPAGVRSAVTALAARYGLHHPENATALFELLASDSGAIPHSELLAAAGVNFFHAAEVNLVAVSAWNPSFATVANSVLPFVALDMATYSAYDSQEANPGLANAIDYIMSKHNPTSASPTRRIGITEFGAPFNEWPLTRIQNMMKNVVATTNGTPYVAYAVWWQSYNNES